MVTTPTLEVKGTADATGYFESWKLEFGLGAEPAQWVVVNGGNSPVKNDTLYLLDLSAVPNGIVSLRLTVTGKYGEVTKSVHLNLNMPTPTVPPTAFPTDTLTAPPTDHPTIPPPPSDTPTIPPPSTETPTLPPVPTDTPSSTPTPSETPVAGQQ